MTFNIQVAGLQGSEILHMRPVSTWSHWDTAVTAAHFGAAAVLMLTVGVDIATAGDFKYTQGIWPAMSYGTGIGTALIAGNLGWNSFKERTEESKKLDEKLETLTELNNEKLEKIREKIHSYLTIKGDKRTVRFVDLNEMYKVSGQPTPSSSPTAAVTVSDSKDYIYVGINHALLSSRDEDRLFGFSAHEVAHRCGPSTHLNKLAYAMTIGNTVLAIGAIVHGIAFLHLSVIPIAVTSLLVVPLIFSDYQRRQEFRADRGSVAITKNWEGIQRGLNAAHATDSDINASIVQMSSKMTYGTFGTGKIGAALFPIVYKYLDKLKSTHPKISRRMYALKILEKQQAHLKPNPN
jgi:Peptidase family M48